MTTYHSEPVIIEASNKSPIAAALLSFFLLGGAGQIYLRQWKKGLILIAAVFMMSLCVPIFGIMIGFLISIISVGDAYGTAQKLSNGNSIREWEFNVNWKVAALAAVLYPLIFALFVFMTWGNPGATW